MKNNINSLIRVTSALVLITYAILICIKQPSNFYDFIKLIPTSLGFSPIYVFVYIKWGWRINCFIKMPRLKKEYEGLLYFDYKGKKGNKEITIIIKQTLLVTNVTIKTDEIVSHSITSEILEENGEHYLYYTYRTNPSSKFIKKNPSQIGTCRLLINNSDELSGSYWTNRQTIGDLEFKNKKNDKSNNSD